MKTRAANILLDVVGSGVGGAVAAAASTFTSENREAEIERLQTPDVSSMLGFIACTELCACRAQELPAAGVHRAPSCMHACCPFLLSPEQIGMAPDARAGHIASPPFSANCLQHFCGKQ